MTYAHSGQGRLKGDTTRKTFTYPIQKTPKRFFASQKKGAGPDQGAIVSGAAAVALPTFARAVRPKGNHRGFNELNNLIRRNSITFHDKFLSSSFWNSRYYGPRPAPQYRDYFTYDRSRIVQHA